METCLSVLTMKYTVIICCSFCQKYLTTLTGFIICKYFFLNSSHSLEFPAAFKQGMFVQLQFLSFALPTDKFPFSCYKICAKHLNSFFIKCVLLAVEHLLLLSKLNNAWIDHCSKRFYLHTHTCNGLYLEQWHEHPSALVFFSLVERTDTWSDKDAALHSQ